MTKKTSIRGWEVIQDTPIRYSTIGFWYWLRRCRFLQARNWKSAFKKAMKYVEEHKGREAKDARELVKIEEHVREIRHYAQQKYIVDPCDCIGCRANQAFREQAMAEIEEECLS
jgi:hypothetical protein